MVQKHIEITEGIVRADYEYWVGKYMDKFYENLEKQQLTGIRCPSCNKIYLPPRKVCGDCFKTIPMEDANWVDLATTGTLVNFTATKYSVSERRKKKGEKTTFIGLIKIDGSDTAIMYPILDAQESDISIGMKVEVVWDTKPTGSPEDIKGFKPAGGT
jgi:uncharacterized OB-fold protein